MTNEYYNDIDKNACAWVRELIDMGELPKGTVDERSIIDIDTDELGGFRRLHFFCGIGGWPLALKLAGWPDDWPVVSASLPCQPFSAAGKRLGKADERHLLPHFIELVQRCDWPVIVGEQVPAAIGHGWLDDLQHCLGLEGYAVGSALLTAAGAGAPHIRQRLYWCAIRESGLRHAIGEGLEGHIWDGSSGGRQGRQNQDTTGSIAETGGDDGWLADAASKRCEPQQDKQSSSIFRTAIQQKERIKRIGDMGAALGGMGNAEHDGFYGAAFAGSDVSTGKEWRKKGQDIPGESTRTGGRRDAGDLSACIDGCTYWEHCDWLYCRDGKYRPVPRGIPPLVGKFESGAIPRPHGFSESLGHGGNPGLQEDATSEARVMRLKGYGNAIQIDTAVLFLSTVLDILHGNN